MASNIQNKIETTHPNMIFRLRDPNIKEKQAAYSNMIYGTWMLFLGLKSTFNIKSRINSTIKYDRIKIM